MKSVMIVCVLLATVQMVARAERVYTSQAVLLPDKPNKCSVSVAIYPTRVAATVSYTKSQIVPHNANKILYQITASTADKAKLKIENKVGSFKCPGKLIIPGQAPRDVTVEVTADVSTNTVDIKCRDASGTLLPQGGHGTPEQPHLTWTP